MQKPKQNNDENSEIQVKLKPFMGMQPGVYLTILYSLVLLIIMFFLLFFPGLKNNGSILIIKTEPKGAAVRVNDVYMGVAGSRIFVPKGSHTIDVVMPGFQMQSEVVQIPGRVFATLFFPKIVKVEYKLKPADTTADGIAAAFALYASDFASWTFAGEPTVAWQVPMSLSEGAYRLGPYAAEAKEELNDIILAASRFTVTKAALRDIIRAKVLLDGKGTAPSPLTLFGSVSDALEFVSDNPKAAKAMFELLPKETAKKIKDSNWYKKSDSQKKTETEAIGQLKVYSISGLNFNNAGDFQDVMICYEPVPRSVFESFLNENPEYREQKTDYFPDEISGLPEIDRNAVTGITWYAAEAFCEWLSLRLPASMSNMEIRLPTENESIRTAFRKSIYRSSLWEWCLDPYAPLNISVPEKAKKAIGSPERTLFRAYEGSPTTGMLQKMSRASLPPDLSSPFVTFRPVIAPKE